MISVCAGTCRRIRSCRTSLSPRRSFLCTRAARSPLCAVCPLAPLRTLTPFAMAAPLHCFSQRQVLRVASVHISGNDFCSNPCSAVRPAPFRQRYGVGPPGAAGVARANPIRWRDRYGLDPASERRGLKQKIGIRRPRIAGRNRCIAGCLEHVTQQSDACETISRRQVTHIGNANERPQNPSGCAPEPTHRCGRVPGRHALTKHEVSAAFEATKELGHEYRRIGEITLKQQQRVSTRVARGARDISHECIHCARVAEPLCASKYREG